MATTTPGTRLTVFLNIDDRWRHGALVDEVVRRARHAGLAGATVLRGIEGFGARSFIHTDRLLDAGDALPAVIVIVDRDDRIRGFLSRLDEIITDGLVTLDPVEILSVPASRT